MDWCHFYVSHPRSRQGVLALLSTAGAFNPSTPQCCSLQSSPPWTHHSWRPSQRLGSGTSAPIGRVQPGPSESSPSGGAFRSPSGVSISWANRHPFACWTHHVFHPRLLSPLTKIKGALSTFCSFVALTPPTPFQKHNTHAKLPKKIMGSCVRRLLRACAVSQFGSV